MAGTIKFRISVKNDAVVITSKDGKKGGNVRARVLRRVVWDLQSPSKSKVKVSSFDLRFERLADAEGAVQTDADWPFMEASVEPEGAKIDEDAGTVRGATRFGGRLVDVGVYKYSVTVNIDDTSYTLDPVIIIEE
jgi:hypothetical protein